MKAFSMHLLWFAVSTIGAKAAMRSSPIVVGYFDAEAQRSLPVSEIPFEHLSHVVLTNALKVDSEGKLHHSTKHRLGEVSGEGLINRLARQKGVALILSVRGFPDDVSLDELSEVEDTRRSFVDNIARQLVDWNADGIEVEWHADDASGGKPRNAPFDEQEQLHLALLCRDLREKLRPLGKTLSIATRPGRKEFTSADLVENFVDWLAVRAYSMQSLKDPNHSSLDDADSALAEWLDLGVKPQQLVLATPLFARPGHGLKNHHHHHRATDHHASVRKPWHELVKSHDKFVVPPGADFHGDVFVDEKKGHSWWASGHNTTRAKARRVFVNGLHGIALRELHHDALGAKDSLVQVVVKTLREHTDAQKAQMLADLPGVSLFQSNIQLKAAKPHAVDEM